MSLLADYAMTAVIASLAAGPAVGTVPTPA
jgi:hypothetical protein